MHVLKMSDVGCPAIYFRNVMKMNYSYCGNNFMKLGRMIF